MQYKAKSTIYIAGKRYEQGQLYELTDKEAKVIGASVLEPVGGKAKSETKAEKPKAPAKKKTKKGKK